MNEEKHPTQGHTNSNFLRDFEALIRNLESECLYHSSSFSNLNVKTENIPISFMHFKTLQNDMVQILFY